MPLVALILIFTPGVPPQRLPHLESRPGECVILARVNDPEPEVTGAPECDVKSAPASTFKIPHALIALETGSISPDTVVKWDRIQQNFDTWERDHTLESAIRWSVYPFFRHTASAIGRERMREWLASLRYGTDSFDGELTAFWTNGDLVISPKEQVVFLQRMFAGKLPVRAAHVATVKAALVMAPGRISNAAGVHPFKLQWPPGTVVRAKTGNAHVNGERISWLVGQLEVGGVQYVFASRVRAADRGLGTTAGADLAARTLSRLVSR